MALRPVLLRFVAALALLCVLLPAQAQPQASQTASVDEGWQVSLLTFSPGPLYWERFGHNALLLRHADHGVAWVFNYGIFDFQQKNFFLNFARGRMLYRLDVQTLEDTLYSYQQAGRWAYEQVLALDPAQRQALAEYLMWNAQPQHAEYRYDYFVANCSTRVRDAIDRVIHGALRRHTEAQASGTTYRFEATRLIAPDPGLMLAMDFVLGPAADRPITVWEQSFVPMVLRDAVRQVRIDTAQGSRPLVAEERWLLRSPVGDGPAAPPRLWPVQLALGLGLGLLLLPRTSRAARGQAIVGVALLALMGALGLLLLVLWTLTEHWAGWENRNLLLLNPLWWALIPVWWRTAQNEGAPGRRSRLLALLLAGLALLSLPLLLLPSAQDHVGWIAVFLPIAMAIALRLWRNGPPMH